MKSSCKIYSFLRAVRGNWAQRHLCKLRLRRLYVRPATPCSGFLLAVDECGQIMLLPAEDIQRLSGKLWIRLSASPFVPACL